MVKVAICIVLVLAVVGGVIWASDQVTLQGERTIYTVNCEQGAWDGLRCTGRLAAGDRHRFLVSKNRNEVVYWISGSSLPSGKYTNCIVTDRDNWSCKVAAGERSGLVSELAYGRPTAQSGEPSTAFRAVTKWKWWALHAGLPGLAAADYGSGSNAPKPRRGHLGKSNPQ